MSPESVQSWLDEHFAQIVAERGVPGASVAVLTQGQVLTAAGGVLSRATGVEVTTDSLFQIGSITKLWTSALVMQLADEGLVDLDAPLRTYLPEFRVGDEAAASAITTRQLLCHVAGFEGDIFTDTGRGDDAVEKYLASIHDIPQLFAPGEVFSYNNTGFVVLGRLVEVLRGKPFDEVLAERLVAPLGSRTSRRARTRRSCTAPPSATCRARTASRLRRRSGRWPAPTPRPARCSP